MLSGASTWASVWAEFLSNPANPWGYNGVAPVMASALEVFAHAYAPRGKPEWDLDQVRVDGVEYSVGEATVMNNPFC